MINIHKFVKRCCCCCCCFRWWWWWWWWWRRRQRLKWQRPNQSVREVDKLIHGWKLFSVMFRFSSLCVLFYVYLCIHQDFWNDWVNHKEIPILYAKQEQIQIQIHTHFPSKPQNYRNSLNTGRYYCFRMVSTKLKLLHLCRNDKMAATSNQIVYSADSEVLSCWT